MNDSSSYHLVTTLSLPLQDRELTNAAHQAMLRSRSTWSCRDRQCSGAPKGGYACTSPNQRSRPNTESCSSRTHPRSEPERMAHASTNQHVRTDCCTQDISNESLFEAKCALMHLSAIVPSELFSEAVICFVACSHSHRLLSFVAYRVCQRLKLM